LTPRGILSGPGSHTRVGKVFAVIVVGAALQVLTQTVLARGLPKAEVGLVSLIIGALPLVSTLSLLGQDSSIVRHLSREGSARYDLPSHARRVILIVTALGILLAVIGGVYYALAGVALGAMIVLAASQNAVTVVTAFQRAAHRYESAIIGTRLPIIVAAVALMVLYANGRLTQGSALWTLLVSYAVSAAVLLARRPFPGGVSSDRFEPVPGMVFREGFLFLGLSVSLSVMVSMDRLVISKLMTLTDLAVYSTIFSITKGFDFLVYAIGYVLMPVLSRAGRVDLKRPAFAIAGIAVIVSVGYLLFGDEIVHFLFKGRYDAGSYLIPAFVLSGVLKLFYSIPSSFIGGRTPTRAVKQFMVVNLATMLLNVALDIVLILRMGLLGAAIATAVAWGLRLIGGIIIMRVYASRTRGSGTDTPALE